MIKQIACRITKLLIKNGTVTPDEREIYEYSFEVLLLTSSSLICIIILSFFFHKTIITLFFLLGFIASRKVSGGYHTNSPISCFLLTMSNYFLFLAADHFLSERSLLLLSLLFGLSALLILFFAPVDNKNKPMSREQKKRFRHQSLLFLVIFTAVFIPAIFIESIYPFILSCSFGVFSVSLSLFFGFIKNKATS